MLYRIITVTALALGGAVLARQIQKNQSTGSHAKETIDINVPLRVAYDQFTHFEDFPRFMEGVQEVQQLDDKRLHWKATVAGQPVEWDAEITEHIADHVIAWRSTSGTPSGGTVTFRPLGRSRTRVTLELYHEPPDGAGMAGEAPGAGRLEARNSLLHFKEMIETRGQETGAWRGTVGQGTGSGAVQ